MEFFLIIAVFCWLAFAPAPHTQFVLDDYYTIVHNPLIKQPMFYPKILFSHLFDYYKSSQYIQFSYYRPVLEYSYIIDYRLFKLDPTGYQWINWAIHLINGWLVFILIWMIFKEKWLAFLTALLFVVLPSHEWVVRYITGRGDSLQTLFGLFSLIALVWSMDTKKIVGYLMAFLSLVLSVLSREFGYLLPFYGALIVYVHSYKDRSILHFGFWWMAIGSLSFLVTTRLLVKLGPIQSLHLWYFTSIGFCLCVACLLLRFSLGKVMGILLAFALALISLSQRPYWSSEEALLRHTHSLENRPYTVCHQQLLMKYDEDISSILGLIDLQKDPIIKSLWFWRLGQIAFIHHDLIKAGGYFDRSLKYNPSNVDSLNARAIVLIESGRDKEGFNILQQAYRRDPSYTETLKNLGIYYFSHKDLAKAQQFFYQARYYEGY